MDCVVTHPRVIGTAPLHFSQTFQNITYYYLNYKTKMDAVNANTVNLNYTVAFTALAGWVCQQHVVDHLVFRGEKDIPYHREIALDMSNCQVNGGGMPVGGFFPGPTGGMLPPATPPSDSMGPNPTRSPTTPPAMPLPRMGRP